ncbi:STAS domain-containing protein [Jiangella mangrovi]|uniref:Anti-anti-sigma regulatory factor n=1 Tax=Jiangella mangrovi TaxID=1524084 RepID=A0A7W9LK29_9ACTN|nr:STAS domain-containing protein [Jiangella mangrovi]MBB5786659.1 anti-anti-sigma regulatory factor [Jiangella mangrovi]
MSTVQVVDRGAREIVVFLSGDVGSDPADEFGAAVEEVDRLEQLNALDHVVVDMHRVTGMTDAAIGFLRELSSRGRRSGFEVSFAALSGPAHRAVEANGWSFVEHSPDTERA